MRSQAALQLYSMQDGKWNSTFIAHIETAMNTGAL
jgi:hypothetical protein